MIKVLFIDFDGTLISVPSGKTFPKGIWDMSINMDVVRAIKKLNPEFIQISTNQGGIQKGFVDRKHFESKIEYVANCLKELLENGNVYWDYCDSLNKDDERRRPNPGILNSFKESLRIFHSYEFSNHEALMVGDASGKPGDFSDEDLKTAENFGCEYLDVKEFVKKWA